MKISIVVIVPTPRESIFNIPRASQLPYGAKIKKHQILCIFLFIYFASSFMLNSAPKSVNFLYFAVTARKLRFPYLRRMRCVNISKSMDGFNITLRLVLC